MGEKSRIRAAMLREQRNRGVTLHAVNEPCAVAVEVNADADADENELEADVVAMLSGGKELRTYQGKTVRQWAEEIDVSWQKLSKVRAVNGWTLGQTIEHFKGVR